MEKKLKAAQTISPSLFTKGLAICKKKNQGIYSDACPMIQLYIKSKLWLNEQSNSMTAITLIV